MPTNIITRFLEGWVSLTHQVENNDNTILHIFLVSEIQIENLKKKKKVLSLALIKF